MSLELKKRIITSFFLFSLLLLMFHFSFILVITIIVIAIIDWIEFYALLSKIFKKNNIKQKIYRFLGKAFSLFYLRADEGCGRRFCSLWHSPCYYELVKAKIRPRN